MKFLNKKFFLEPEIYKNDDGKASEKMVIYYHIHFFYRRVLIKGEK